MVNSTIVAFLDAWKRQDFETMYEHVQLSWKSRHSLDDLKDLFSSLKLKDYSEVSVKHNPEKPIAKVEVTFDFTTDLRLKKSLITKKVLFNVICEKDTRNPSTNGTWGVNPISVWRFMG